MTIEEALAFHAAARRYGNQTGAPSIAIHVGAADEIARATIQRLGRSGMSVVACDPDEARLRRMEAELEAVGGAGLMLGAGSGSQADIDAVVARTLSAYGRLDVLIIGMSSLTDGAKALGWFRTASPHIAAAGGGHIVSVVSSLGRYRSSYFRYDAGPESALDRSAAEAAIVALTRQAAFELAAQKIRVNAVAVGWVRDEATEAAWRALSERDRAYLLEEISLRRLGEPEEVAAVIEFLATGASSYVTGTVIDVNGGLWMS
jgi:NAD(P)-dependent dehydrogenase (short-subunit alcohol dehydrogenase family)